jgi:ABC-type sugar transport system substrate-binding protein
MKKILAILCTLCLALGMLGAGYAESTNIVVALITMDSIDQHWITLHEGAQKAADEFGVELKFMAPNTKDDAQQIECVNNAVSAGVDVIIVAANGPDAITSALDEAKAAGVKIIYVDSPANVPAEATFSTDNKAAGKTAGEEMLAALTAAGITEGSIGIVNVNAATNSTVLREEGFRIAKAVRPGRGCEIPDDHFVCNRCGKRRGVLGPAGPQQQAFSPRKHQPSPSRAAP